jgi:hypothetical protein
VMIQWGDVGVCLLAYEQNWTESASNPEQHLAEPNAATLHHHAQRVSITHH